MSFCFFFSYSFSNLSFFSNSMFFSSVFILPHSPLSTLQFIQISTHSFNMICVPLIFSLPKIIYKIKKIKIKSWSVYLYTYSKKKCTFYKQKQTCIHFNDIGNYIRYTYKGSKYRSDHSGSSTPSSF